MADTDGGPAYPTKVDDWADGWTHRGMTLRDYFAGQALASIPLRGWNDLRDTEKPDAWARLAYVIADAMLAAREVTP